MSAIKGQDKHLLSFGVILNTLYLPPIVVHALYPIRFLSTQREYQRWGEFFTTGLFPLTGKMGMRPEPPQLGYHQGTMQRTIHQIKLMPVSTARGWVDPSPFFIASSGREETCLQKF